MIYICINHTTDQIRYTITGHAEAPDLRQKIEACAAITALAHTLNNAAQTNGRVNDFLPGSADIQLYISHETQALIEAITQTMYQIQEAYPDAVQIEYRYNRD